MSKLTIAINTAVSRTSIALFENENLLAEKSWESESNEAEKLMPEINSLLKKKKKNAAEINRVIVVKGPGSFTGLRVGVTVANAIAYLNKCDLFGVDTCEYLWESLVRLAPTVPYPALLLFAGSKGVYISQNHESADKAELINLPDLNHFLKAKNITQVFGDISKDQKKSLEQAVFLESKMTFGEIMRKIIAKISGNKIKPVKIIEPIYIKKPAITESKKKIF